MRLIDADGLIIKINDYFDKCEKRGIAPSTFGVNRHIKAMATIDQWHYPSKGEYPTDKDVKVLVRTMSNNYYIASFNLEWITSTPYITIINIEDVKCWQYIIPPKEEA